MHFKINAGAEVEIATPDEVRDIVNKSMRGWQAEIARGVKAVRRSMSGVAVGGSIALGAGFGASGQDMGPEAGFVWSVRRITVTGLTGAEVQPVNINSDQDSDRIALFGVGVNGTRTFESGAVTLLGNDRLVSVNVGLVPNEVITVVVSAWEVPTQLIHLLV